MEWFRLVSHPYVIDMAEDDCPVLISLGALAHQLVAMHPQEKHPEHPTLVCMNH